MFKKGLLVLAILAVLLVPVMTMPAMANGNHVYEYNSINLDGGMLQQTWATDYYSSTLTLTHIEGDCYEYERIDTGIFKTFAGDSPAGTGQVGADVIGDFNGKITGEICGVLRDVPDLSNKDFRNGDYPSYAVKYFGHIFVPESIHGFNFSYWGWVYSTCFNGTWTDNDQTERDWREDKNAMGDITGDYIPCPTPVVEVPYCDLATVSVFPDTYQVDESLIATQWTAGGEPVYDHNGLAIREIEYSDRYTPEGVLVQHQAHSTLVTNVCMSDIDDLDEFLADFEAYLITEDGVVPVVGAWYEITNGPSEYRAD